MTWMVISTLQKLGLASNVKLPCALPATFCSEFFDMLALQRLH